MPRPFTPWHGGECPVPHGTRVDVRHRDGCVHTNEPAGPEGVFAEDWNNDGDSADIVAWRLHESVTSTDLYPYQRYIDQAITQAYQAPPNANVDVPTIERRRLRLAGVDLAGVDFAALERRIEQHNDRVLAQGGAFHELYTTDVTGVDVAATERRFFIPPVDEASRIDPCHRPRMATAEMRAAGGTPIPPRVHSPPPHPQRTCQ